MSLLLARFKPIWIGARLILDIAHLIRNKRGIGTMVKLSIDYSTYQLSSKMICQSCNKIGAIFATLGATHSVLQYTSSYSFRKYIVYKSNRPDQQTYICKLTMYLSAIMPQPTQFSKNCVY